MSVDLENRDQALLSLNQTLLESVVVGDWDTYASLCATDLTCFEAETNCVLAEGLPFHKFYFDLPTAPPFKPVAGASDHGTSPHPLDRIRCSHPELHASDPEAQQW